MSKLSFRAKALDGTKPMPIYKSEELPDLTDYSAINRAVPQMPSGMEKAEECEHHLQRAICTGLIIPTPEVSELTEEEAYKRIYPENYKLPRQLIHMQPFAMEQDIPDYDMDSEDEKWVNTQARKMDLTPLKFEEMMDRLEKGSGQTVVTLQEAKSLLKEDDDLIIAVYDYWLNKRLTTQHPLIPAVKTEHRHGSAVNNPYLAFLRRAEKMQTRKNRKNDESSYEKMLKLRRDLTRAVTLLEFVKRREKTKLEYLHLTIEVYEKRYQANDFSGQMLSEVSALKTPRPAFAPLFTNQFGLNHQNWSYKVVSKDDAVPRKEKRQYKKRKHKTTGPPSATGTSAHGMGSRGSTSTLVDPLGYGYACTSEEDTTETLTNATGQSDEEPDPLEGPFAFRRKRHCSYHAPLSGLTTGNWPWTSREDGGLADRRYRYNLTSLSTPQRKCIGYARRRVGRGGRIILDRASTSIDDVFSSLDFTIHDSNETKVKNDSQTTPLDGSSEGLLHFRPKTPTPLTSTASDAEEIEPDPWPSGITEDPILPALDGTPLNMDVECISQDIFKLDGGSDNYATQLDLNENSKSHYEFPYDESSILLAKTNSDDEVYHFGSSSFQLKPSRYSTEVRQEQVNSKLKVFTPPIVNEKRQEKKNIHKPDLAPYSSPTTNGANFLHHEPSTSTSSGVVLNMSESVNNGWDDLSNGPLRSSHSNKQLNSSYSITAPSTQCSTTTLNAAWSTTPHKSSGTNLKLARRQKSASSVGDATLNSDTESMDLDGIDTLPIENVSNQVCVDKKTLVRKNTTLAMEVT